MDGLLLLRATSKCWFENKKAKSTVSWDPPMSLWVHCLSHEIEMTVSEGVTTSVLIVGCPAGAAGGLIGHPCPQSGSERENFSEGNLCEAQTPQCWWRVGFNILEANKVTDIC